MHTASSSPPDRVKGTSRLHKHNDPGVRDKAAVIKAGKHGDGDGGHGPPGCGGRPGPGNRSGVTAGSRTVG
ncbi:hypothetical protein [Streptomyces sp. NPDC088766]|uniref:hypothetical protein n=1 Tax=Streptomyces sp. NPDC088766 TaxID=3365893 RepID=UPI0038290F44